MANEENPFEHILYEFSMYLSSVLFVAGDQMTFNLLADSHMLHLRNLAYFFDKKINCDIHAAIYVEHPEVCLIESKQLGDIYHITNCASCHMSSERLKPNFKQKTQECEDLALKMMKPLIARYLNLLDTDLKPEYLTLWKDEKIQEFATTVKQMIGVQNV